MKIKWISGMSAKPAIVEFIANLYEEYKALQILHKALQDKPDLRVSLIDSDERNAWVLKLEEVPPEGERRIA